MAGHGGVHRRRGRVASPPFTVTSTRGASAGGRLRWPRGGRNIGKPLSDESTAPGSSPKLRVTFAVHVKAPLPVLTFTSRVRYAEPGGVGNPTRASDAPWRTTMVDRRSCSQAATARLGRWPRLRMRANGDMRLLPRGGRYCVRAKAAHRSKLAGPLLEGGHGDTGGLQLAMKPVGPRSFRLQFRSASMRRA